MTYQVNGLEALPLGYGDQHDSSYDSLGVTSPFVQLQFPNEILDNEACQSELKLSIYPSKVFEESFYTNTAEFYAAGVIAIFGFTSLVFLIYDVTVRRRQSKVMARVIQQDKIVSNMFPSAIRDRLYRNDDKNKKGKGNGELDWEDSESQDIFGNVPLAELYPNVTVIFADTCGFTAWSSAREPPQ